MALFGLPDFQHLLRDGGVALALPYGGPSAGPATLLPDRLELARNQDGTPDFRLTFIRPVNPMLPPEPYATLAMGVRPQYAFDEALGFARSRHADLTVEAARPASGYLRFEAVPGAPVSLPKALTQPSPLTWNGLTGAGADLRLTPEEGVFLRAGLEEDVLAIRALAEFELMGVAARVAADLEFDPAATLAALHALADGEGRISRTALEAAAIDPEAFGFKVEPHADAEPSASELAEVLADRVRARFGALAPAPVTGDGPHLWLIPRDSAGTGIERCDLSQPTRTWRGFALHLDPIGEARAALGRGAGDTLLPPTVVVPPISSGLHQVHLTANLPRTRLHLAAAGVTLVAPPRLPARPQASVQTLEFQPPEDAGEVSLRLAPNEALTYRAQTFCVLDLPDGPQHVEGQSFEHVGNRLRLGPGDFPLEMLAVEASLDLCELAHVTGACVWAAGRADFELTLADRELMLALPQEAGPLELRIDAVPKSVGRAACLQFTSARSVSISLASFAGFGPQRIAILCRFEGSEQIAGIELVTESRGAEAAPEQVIALTPASPSGEWHYLATSPFTGGYRYRLRASTGSDARPWSEVQLPGAALEVVVA